MRDLTQATLSMDQTVKAPLRLCFRCRSKRKLPALRTEDVPEALRNLTLATQAALSPLEIDVGAVQRAKAGYRQKMSMMRFRWQPWHAKDRIMALPTLAEQQAGKRAYQFLCQNDQTLYKDFDQEHLAFLGRHPWGDERCRLHPLHFIERDGIECALWPWLFWEVALTFSRERLSNPTRGQAQVTFRFAKHFLTI